MKAYRASGTAIALSLLSAIRLLTPAHAQLGPGEAFVRQAHEISPGVDIPHTEWAKPYAQGTTRVLVFCGAYQLSPRTRRVDLEKAFDIETEGVYWGIRYAAGWFKREPELLGGDVGRKRMTRLLEDDYDCYVLDIGEELLTDEAQYKILKKVSEGAGLVVMGDAAERPLDIMRDNLKQAANPDRLAADKYENLETYKIGKGRAVRLGGHHGYPLPNIIGAMVGYDHAIEAYGKAILWAARKEPRFSLEVQYPGNAQQGQAGGMPVKISWPGFKCLSQAKADIWVRGVDGIRHSIAEDVVLDQTGGQMESASPVLSAGEYAIEARVTSDQGVETWSTKLLTITSKVACELDWDNKYLERGQAITGKVTVKGLENRTGAAVLVKLYDVNGRILDQQKLPLTGEVVNYSIATDASTPSMVRVAADVYSGGVPVQQSSLGHEGVFAGKHVFLRTRNHEHFGFTMWGKVYNQPLRPYMAMQLADAGVTVHFERYPDWEMSAGDLAVTQYATRIKYALDQNGLPEGGAWNDPEAHNKRVQDIIARTEGARQRGAYSYDLGDENDTFGVDKSEHDLRAYREYLAGVYPNIEALNESWGTDFDGFDAVVLSDPDDLLEGIARREGNFPRWFDRQAFSRYNYAMLVKRFGEAIREVDPQARVGFECAGGLEDNIDLLARSTKYWVQYCRTTMEIVSSITGPDFVTGVRSADWELPVRGGRTMFFWRVDNQDGASSFLGADMAVAPGAREYFAGMQNWLKGLGTTMMRAERQHSGVVLMHSFPSAWASKILGGPAYGLISKDVSGPDGVNITAWTHNVRGSHVQYHFVTGGMMDRGEWDSGKDKLLILPQISALSAKQVSAIKEFAATGGTVVADVQPGLFDEHVKQQKNGLLDDLFGVRHTGNVEARECTAVLRGNLGGVDINGSLGGLEVNPALELAGGEALGSADGVPVMIVNKYGRGNALLLNFTPRSMPGADENDSPAVVHDILEGILNAGSVRPAIRITGRRGEQLRDVEVARWNTGSNEIVCLFQSSGDVIRMGKPEIITCYMDDSRHKTDITAGRYISKDKEFQVELAKAVATFILLSAAKPSPVKLGLTETVKRGDTLEVQASAFDGSLRYLRLEANGPDGKRARWFERVQKAENGRVTFELPIAVNEQTGEWELEVTDVISGQSAIAGFVVQ